MKAFWFHYNKPESRKCGKTQITIHYLGSCHIVDNLECSVPIKGRLRKAQPFWVIAGKANSIIMKNGVAYIN